jgi:hypothetical protein
MAPLIALCMLVVGASGFGQHSNFLEVTTTRHCSPTLLWAKAAAAAKKSKSKKAHAPSSTGGFGKVATSGASSTKANDDFAAFPALEPRVVETLVSSPLELQQMGGLPGEIYDVLEQIYGFPNFNHQKYEEDNGGTMSSFDDLISFTGDASSTASTGLDNLILKQKEAAGSDDLADLLAFATGESVPSSKSSTSATESSSMKAISSLPPFSKFRILHIDPLLIAVDDFFSDEECDRYVAMVNAPSSKNKDAPFQSRSKTVGKDALAKAQRTSTTWFNHYKAVPELMAKASRLLGLQRIDQWEEPQIVR